MKLIKQALCCITATLAISFTPVSYAKPVNVGHGMPNSEDACSLGEVTGLNPNGDGFLAVRNSPTTSSGMKDKIHNGQQVWMCDQNASGTWVGVIYTKKGIDCGLDVRGNYQGRCYHGWVSAKYVKVIAG